MDIYLWVRYALASLKRCGREPSAMLATHRRLYADLRFDREKGKAFKTDTSTMTCVRFSGFPQRAKHILHPLQRGIVCRQSREGGLYHRVADESRASPRHLHRALIRLRSLEAPRDDIRFFSRGAAIRRRYLFPSCDSTAPVAPYGIVNFVQNAVFRHIVA